MTNTQSTIANNAIRLRKLARKSIIGFGKYADNTVQEIIDKGAGDYLVWLYYNNANIDFLDDIKAEVRITKLILKPGISTELGASIIRQHYQETWEDMTEEEKKIRRCKIKVIARKKHRIAVKRLERIEREVCKKSVLQMYNHGKNK